jgi:ABC-2 type transport system ATP-binding protein
MKQKVLIASTLLHEPKLVFLDEPTSRLDPAASALVKELILALAEQTDTSFFICTHMTDFAEDVCDIIGIISSGDLVITGSPQEIIESVGATDLEDAYLKIVGGKVDRETLLAWR